MESSCLMLMMSLFTPIDLDFVLDPNDLAEEGIEENSHITVFYSSDISVPKENILKDMKEFLGESDYVNLLEFLKAQRIFPIYDILGLDKFENQEYDVLIMRLKEGNKLSKILGKLNAGFTEKYSLKSDFNIYRPHMTLSYLRPGTADKYLSNPTLGKVLDDSKVSYDDLMVSYKKPEDVKYTEKYLTTYNCIERHLWQEKLRRNKMKS